MRVWLRETPDCLVSTGHQADRLNVEVAEDGPERVRVCRGIPPH
nr:MAG TPA: peptidase [Caudoviricetes sp.]